MEWSTRLVSFVQLVVVVIQQNKYIICNFIIDEYHSQACAFLYEGYVMNLSGGVCTWVIHRRGKIVSCNKDSFS